MNLEAAFNSLTPNPKRLPQSGASKTDQLFEAIAEAKKRKALKQRKENLGSEFAGL